MHSSTRDLLSDEHNDIRVDIRETVPDPDRWIYQPNDQLGGKRPQDLIGTSDEHHLRDLLRAIKYGVPT